MNPNTHTRRPTTTEAVAPSSLSLHSASIDDASGTCIEPGGANTVVVSASTPPTPPPCDAVVSAEIPEASWGGTTASLCSPASDGHRCDDGVCAPPTEPDALLCIAREGEHPSPLGSSLRRTGRSRP
jgi:hypothetical protein